MDDYRRRLTRLHGVLRALVDIKRCGLPNDNSALHEQLADGMLVLHDMAETADRALTLARNNARTLERKIRILRKRVRELEGTADITPLNDEKE